MSDIKEEKEQEIVVGGVHNFTEEDNYVWETNPKVAEHLEWFRGLKLGFMMHWAPVGQLGLMESWPLSDEDRSWSQVEVDWTDDIEEFKEQYWNLNKTFNPVKFRPDKWATLAKECGFKYLLFTTKHHDGFCMYDTKQTDYKITAPDCPFSTNKRADIVKAMFDAFRGEGLAISAYFSKPDWHSDAYWHRDFGTAPTRNVNYDVKKYPKLWEEFVQYTQAQLLELTSNYGKIDTLWLDGGWVRPSVDGQDIRLGEVVDKIRATTQPHLICCDRTVGGAYENIVTPEQSIPDRPMDIPWETCMTISNCFAFHYDDEVKSAREVLHKFIEIVSKGGSLALNIAPQPDGALPQKAMRVMRQMGAWLKVNGDAIYESHISKNIAEGRVCYTAKAGKEFVIYMYDESPKLPTFVYTTITDKVKSIKLIRTGEDMPFSYSNKGELILDTTKVSLVGAEYADCYEVTI